MPQRDKFSAPQGEPFHEQFLRSVSEGILGGGVVERNDLEVSANGTNDGVLVEAGSLWYPPDTFSVGSQQSLSATTSPSDDRWDTVVYDTGTSSLSYNEGTAGTNPEPPMPTGDEFPLAFVYVPKGGGVQDSNVHNWRPAASRRKNIKTETKTVSSDYTTSNERIIFVDTSGSAVTITLASADRYDGAAITVADIQGNASSNNITITDGTGDNIAGAANQTIQIDYGSLTVKSDGSSWTTAGGGSGGGNLAVENGGSSVTDPTETIDFQNGLSASAGAGTNEAAVNLDESYQAAWSTLQSFQSGIQLNDGTTTTPAFRFANDSNTGIARTGTDELALASNGNGLLFVKDLEIDIDAPVDLSSGLIKDGGTDAVSLDGSANVEIVGTSLKLPDGDALDPGLRFINDADTGITRPSSDLLALVTNATVQLSVTGSGVSLQGNDLDHGPSTTIWDASKLHVPRAQQDLNQITKTVSSNTTTSDEEIIFVDSSAGTYTITLASADAVDGNQIAIIDDGGNASSNNITIDTESTETIEGSSSVTISDDYGSYLLESNGSNWRVVAQTPASGGGASSLSDLSDANVSSPAAGETLLYDATDSQFENADITAGTALSATTADASLTLDTNLGNGVELDGSDNIRVNGGAVAGNVLSEDGTNPYQINLNIGNGLEDNTGTLRANPAGIAGDGLKETSATSMGVEPADFAGTLLSDDGSDNLQVDEGSIDHDAIDQTTVDEDDHHVRGGFARGDVTSQSTTASAWDSLWVDTSAAGGAVTVTLPADGNTENGDRVEVGIEDASNDTDVVANTGQSIIGSNPTLTQQGDTVTMEFKSSNSTWMVR